MLNLIREERRVILFLITTALVGIGVDFLVKRYSPVKTFIYSNQNIGKINLNEADKEILISIPGIGEKLASRIIEYRKEHSGFNDLEELKKIKGINDYRYEKLKDFLFVKQL